MNGRLIGAIAFALLLAGAAAWLMLRSGTAGGPQVANENPCDVFPSLNGALAEWMQEQRKLAPGLTCEHFDKVSESTPVVRPAAPWVDAGKIMERAPQRWLARERRRMLLPTAGSLSLVDLDAGTRRTLLVGESGGSWVDAGWMDGRSFVAAGVQAGPVAGMQAATLTVFRLDTNRVTVFRGPSAPLR